MSKTLARPSRPALESVSHQIEGVVVPAAAASPAVTAVFEGGRVRFTGPVPFADGDRLTVAVSTPAALAGEGEASEPAAGAGEAFPGESLLDGPDDPLAGIRFEGPPDLAENHVDYKLGRKSDR